MSEPFLGEIKVLSFSFAPKGWALCNGQLMPINQNQGLFSLLGTMYGGDGRVNFGLPDLRSRVPLHVGQGLTQGEAGGEAAHTLTLGEMAAHNHSLNANTTTDATANAFLPGAGNSIGKTIGQPSQGSPFQVNIYSTDGPNGSMGVGTVGNTGGSQPHENRQPYLGLNMAIALIGIFPSRN